MNQIKGMHCPGPLSFFLTVASANIFVMLLVALITHGDWSLVLKATAPQWGITALLGVACGWMALAEARHKRRFGG